MNTKNRPVCPSGKVRYRDDIAAKVALAKILNDGEARSKDLQRSYRCPLCRGHHLTSQGRKT